MTTLLVHLGKIAAGGVLIGLVIAFGMMIPLYVSFPIVAVVCVAIIATAIARDIRDELRVKAEVEASGFPCSPRRYDTVEAASEWGDVPYRCRFGHIHAARLSERIPIHTNGSTT